MIVFIDNRENKHEVSDDFIIKVINDSLDYLGFKNQYEVSVSLINDDEMIMLNKQYRGKDSTTDVLSFPMLPANKPIYNEEQMKEYSHQFLEINAPLPLGDIVISMPKAYMQAKEYGHSSDREIAFLIIHSILHLLGYDHERSDADEKEMFSLQDNVLKHMNIGGYIDEK